MSTSSTLENPTAADATTTDASGMPQMPTPVAEHAWLEQFVGEWTTVAELHCSPDSEPMTAPGRESIRMIGGFWLVSETVSTLPEMPYSSIFTVGYSPEKSAYVGTWVDSMTSRLWSYEGRVENGDTLILLTEGGCPMQPGKLRAFRETLTIKSPDHKLFTSEMQQDDGSWRTNVVVNAHRVK